jgi:Rps23 Pro-64 3,4-dihydroxylase Tpa1-like proline 4-hydroxylase
MNVPTFSELHPVAEPILFPETVLTIDECQELVQIFEKYETRSGVVFHGNPDHGSYEDGSARTVDISAVDKYSEQDKKFFDQCDYKIKTAVDYANQTQYGYDLIGMEPLQFARYKLGGHYIHHTDCESVCYGDHRKLSFSVQINPTHEFNGGKLLFGQEDPDHTKIRIQQGQMVLFPSFLVHTVTPVTYGVRYSIFGWVRGPRWK